jgi:hypothetical protein
VILGSPVGGSLLGDVAVGGYAGVNALQKALRDLAVKAQNSNCDPSSYDGLFTLGTVIALANTGSVLGAQVHPTVGKALDVVALIKAPFEAIPYGESVINVILSPWLIDNVYDILLAIIRLFPGGGSVATGISNAVNAFKTVLSTASAPLATAITLATTQLPTATPVPPSPPTLGEVTLNPAFVTKLSMVTVNPASFSTSTSVPVTGQNPPPGFTWAVDHWERARAGVPPVPGPVSGGSITVRTHPTMANGPRVSATVASPMSAAEFIASVKGAIRRDHRAWPQHKQLATAQGTSDWDEGTAYSAKVPLADLYFGDANIYIARARVNSDVAQGRAAFRLFTGKQGQPLGAFWDKRTQLLRIHRVAKQSSKKGHWYDFLGADIFDDIGDFVGASWDWVKENADDVYAAVKKYSCLVVNNDTVVAIAAAGAGIVATPAASGAVVSGAAAGRAGCAALSIGEAIYAIIKFLAMGHPPAPALTNTPPNKAAQIQAMVSATGASKAGFAVVMPPTRPAPPLKPSDVFPMPATFGSSLTTAQLAALALGGLVLGGLLLRRL